MLSKSLSTSRRYAALHVVDADLAEFCQGLYPLLVAHSDDFGRQSGDAFTIKHVVCPTSPRSEDDIEAALVALAEVGLIVRYNSDGEPAVAIVKFKTHQPGLKQRGGASKFGEPPEALMRSAAEWDPRQCRALPRDAVGCRAMPSELNRTELNRTEEKRTTEAPKNGASVQSVETAKARVSTLPSSPVTRFLVLYEELFEKAHGTKPVIVRTRDPSIAKQLITKLGEEHARELLRLFFKSDDPWIQDVGHGLNIFAGQANKLLSSRRMKKPPGASVEPEWMADYCFHRPCCATTEECRAKRAEETRAVTA